MLRLYNTALLPLRAAARLWAALQRDPRKRAEWAERCTLRLPEVDPGGVWIHGASVGEARIVASLARAIRNRRAALPLAVSAYTPTGRSQLPEPPAVDTAFYAPLDFPAFAARILAALRPAAMVLVETELWPNLLDQARLAGVPVVVLNGRLSSRRMARYRRLSPLYRPLIERVSCLGVQSAEDAERFLELGAPASATSVTGNVKYDLAPPAADAGELRRELHLAPGRPVLVAGSTAPDEEPQVLIAFRQARQACANLLLVLAPRHPARNDEVQRCVRDSGLRSARLSGRPSTDDLDVLLVDTLGELPALYQLATVAFVGGSLVPIGGHNVLEPAAVGVPVLYGPHTENVREPVAALERAGGGMLVRGAAELGSILEQLLQDDERRTAMARNAAEVVQANRGALERSVELLMATLGGHGSRPRAGAA